MPRNGVMLLLATLLTLPSATAAHASPPRVRYSVPPAADPARRWERAADQLVTDAAALLDELSGGDLAEQATWRPVERVRDLLDGARAFRDRPAGGWRDEEDPSKLDDRDWELQRLRERYADVVRDLRTLGSTGRADALLARMGWTLARLEREGDRAPWRDPLALATELAASAELAYATASAELPPGLRSDGFGSPSARVGPASPARDPLSPAVDPRARGLAAMAELSAAAERLRDDVAEGRGDAANRTYVQVVNAERAAARWSAAFSPAVGEAVARAQRLRSELSWPERLR